MIEAKTVISRCRDSFIGPRCDYKHFETVAGSNRVLLETASITRGALAALVVSIIVGVSIFIKKQSKKGKIKLENQIGNPCSETMNAKTVRSQTRIPIKY